LRHCLIVLFLQLAGLSIGRAQVVLDGKFGTSGAITPVNNNFDITASLGKMAGPNLFHSFSQFDITAGQIATFSGPSTIQNILARITGANASSIDGTLRSTIDGANLFFLNPHGVVFGQNAQLDVKGSFVVTSAHYIGLFDGNRFDTVNPSANDPLLSSAAPSAFGFLGPTVAPISFTGCSLSVPNQKSLSVIGGDIQIKNGQLTAAGGRINIVSLGSAGTVALDVNNLNAALDTSSFATLGSLTMNNSILFGDDQSSVGGGKVVVQAQELTFDGSGIEASSLGSENSLGVDVTVRDQMILQNMSFIFSDEYSTSTGNGGDINIQAHELQVLSASAITCDVHGTGHGGNINVSADTIFLDGQTVPNSFAGIGARTDSSGNAGDVALTAQTLNIRNGMIVSTVSAGSGNAGNTTVSASAINIDGHGTTSGIIADTTDGGGNGGDVAITTASLEISNAGRISSATGGAGHGGNVNITATDSIQLDGEEGVLFTGIGVPPLASATGKGGDLVINTPLLEILNGARILAGTQGAGAGGNINVTATDIVLDGGDATLFTGIEAQTSGSGNAGGITINAGSLRLANGAQINVDTSSPGAGGDIDITAHSVAIESASMLSATSDGQGQGGKITVAADSILVDGARPDGSVGFAGIFAGNPFGVQGNASAGDIVIGPGASGSLSVQLLNGAEISASTKGASDGGNIVIDATTLTLDNHASIQCATVGSGQAGNISLTVQDLQLTGNSSIAVPAASQNGGNIVINVGSADLQDSTLDASAGKNGGNITLNAGTQVSLLNSTLDASASDTGGNITLTAGSRASLHTSSLDATAGKNGGDITLTVGSLIYLLDSTITASAGDNGGNITIDPDFLVLDHSPITANAINNNGGNINVLSEFFLSSDSSITADSQFGNPGTVLIQAVELDLTASLVSLTASLLGAESQLRERCGVRAAGGISSFLVLGRGGAPFEPNGPLPTFGLGPAGGQAN
jgi:filamentous hemagglutinin family protein